jgi:hypothetical protein
MTRLLPLTYLALLAACTPSGDKSASWALGRDTALTRLQKADSVGFLAAMACGQGLEISNRPSESGMDWQIDQGLSHVAKISVKLVAENGSQTSAQIDAPDSPALRQPLASGVQELVAAAMEQRGLDKAKLSKLACPAKQQASAAPSVSGAQTQADSAMQASADTASPVPERAVHNWYANGYNSQPG